MGWVQDNILPWLTPAAVIGAAAVAVTLFNGRFDSIEKQYADVSQRITNLDNKIDTSAKALGDRIEKVTTRLDDIIQQQSKIAADVAASRTAIGGVERELDYVKGRVEQIAQRVQAESPKQSPVVAYYAPLSTEQRTKIHDVVTRERSIPSRVELSIGRAVPKTVLLRSLPKSVRESMPPELRDAGYVETEQQIAVVDRKSREVVDLIPK